ncbi:MAG TPA: patatin-like phospholipase family protein [Deltaproteobacteria bacterium]|nr:patatin-like phospholipase family protein [Deltaproteobacteria bacterium]
MHDDLLILAGKIAWERIREQGLDPGDISVVAGASGAAKWLIISELDKAIFGPWMKDRRKPLLLFGTSIGAWKLAAASQNDPAAALDALADAYIHQYYKGRVTAGEVTREGRRILDAFIPQERVPEILSHPWMRFSLSTVRCRGFTASRGIFPQMVGLGTAFLANAASRRLLSLFFERALFCDPRGNPGFFQESEFPIQRIPLNDDNFRPALLASGSIPLAMEGVMGIPGARPGVYRDGGILDYHPSSFGLAGENGIVCYPHFSMRLIPGWFDKALHTRKPAPACLDHLLLLVPSPEFVSRLPYGRIPDRKDFERFHGRDTERVAFWKEAVSKGRRLADAFMESVLGGSIRTKVRRLEDHLG